MCNPWHLSFSHYCIHIFWNKVPWWSLSPWQMLAVVLKFNSSHVQSCSQTSLRALRLSPGSYGDRRPNENTLFPCTKSYILHNKDLVINAEHLSILYFEAESDSLIQIFVLSIASPCVCSHCICLFLSAADLPEVLHDFSYLLWAAVAVLHFFLFLCKALL